MIYFFNDEKELQKVVNSKNVINAVHEQELNGLILSQVELDLFYAKKFIEKVTYFGYFYDETFYMHKIKRVEDNHHEETVIIVGRHIFFEDMLKGKLIEDIRPVNRDAKYVLENTVTVNTGWQIEQDGVTKHLNGSFYWNLPMEVIDKVVEEWQIDYEPRINFDGKKITRRYVHVSEKINKDLGKRIVFGSKVLELKYEVDYDGIITKLVVHGKGEEVGDGYGRRIDIANIDFKRNGVISPKGERYLYNAALIEEYGELYGREVFEDIEDVNELANAGYEFYLENSRPKMLFESSIAQIGSVKIGEIVTIIRHEHDLYFKTRIHKLSVDLLNPSDAQVELGDYEHFKESKVDRIERKNNEIVKKQTSNRIESLKRQFDTEFDAQVDEFRKEFEQKLIDVNAEIEASEQRMKDRADEIERQTSQNLADFSNAFTEYADNIRTETKQYADILNASVTQSVTTLRSALDNAEGTIATITNDLSSVKTQVGTIGRDYVKSAELNVLSGEIQKRVLKSEYDAFTDTTTRKLNETVSTAEGNSTLIAQATGRIDDLAKWRADKGQAIEETIDSYSRKIWRDDIDNLQIGGRNLLENSANMNNSWKTEVTSYIYLLRPRIQSITPKVKVGDTLTFSLDIEAEDTTAIRIYDSNGNPSMSFGNHNFVVQKGKQRISFTTTLKESSSKSTVWYMDIYNNNNGVKFSISKIKIEKGNKATDWTPAPEDAEARITEIKQTADRVALQAQAIADDYVKQSGVVVTGDKVQIGSKIVNGDVLASLITVSPSAIDVITDNLNLKGSLTVTNQIKTMALDAVYANISSLRTRMLTSDVITADMVKFDTAMIEKFTSNTAFINSLFAKSATIGHIQAIDIDLNRATVTGGDSTNYIRMTNQTVMSYGTFTRSWGGETDTARLELGLYDGQLRMRNLDTGYRLYLTERGLSTSMEGAIDQFTSGTLEFHSQRFNHNSRGITMHSSYGAVAMVSDYSTAVIRSNLTANIESNLYSIYFRPYRESRLGVNEFRLWVKDGVNASATDGVLSYGNADAGAASGIRFQKTTVGRPMIWATNGNGDIGTGNVRADSFIGDLEAVSDFVYAIGQRMRVISNKNDKASYADIQVRSLILEHSYAISNPGNQDVYFGVGGGELRLTNNNHWNRGSPSYRDLRLRTLRTMSSYAFENHSGGDTYFGVGGGILIVTDNNHYNGGNTNYRDFIARKIFYTDSFSYRSTEEAKKDIKHWNINASKIIEHLPLFSYRYKDNTDGDLHHGVIIERGVPEFWLGTDRKTVKLNETIYTIAKALQEQIQLNKNLKKRIKKLEENK